MRHPRKPERRMRLTCFLHLDEDFIIANWVNRVEYVTPIAVEYGIGTLSGIGR
jgi:hypothetical protein